MNSVEELTRRLNGLRSEKVSVMDDLFELERILICIDRNNSFTNRIDVITKIDANKLRCIEIDNEIAYILSELKILNGESSDC